MERNYKTEQESFWAGEFGDSYVERNAGAARVASNTAFFTKVLARTSEIKSAIEFGPNIGLNLLALRNLLPNLELCGVEIKEKAVRSLEKIPGVEVRNESLIQYQGKKTYDLSLVKGVLIHINPGELATAYRCLYESSQKYICIAEYYSPTPVAIPYRGHEDRLFKRDFANELQSKYPDLKLLDYGFVYRYDPNFPQDDLTWFLFQKP